ncbi:hypothetical protein [Saccharococcus caldoxylosilyticus]|uniref:Uncharacterized protein n=2 Tax=Saccharococcus caldoxylosilyticus TaxID=81408 RepID=A0A023DK27_9BACL|nr:hypothetical protein [Parageobacillus caldoxylosilyticus]KYD07071.1 hypothetical protein B4119_0983 [Parageobacillus caldoxylosilyticus]MBB3854451.1 hypothetical protein [Parageobacillus caldoxylosilyticus]GAJ41588.1 hypothetical protein GCA01S_078_00020 [Parageobacillus caldoxylosilyticus NBRC 107762]
MKKINMKTEFINCLDKAFELAANGFSEVDKSDIYMTYLTGTFLVSGKFSKLEKINVESREELYKDLKEKLSSQGVNVFSLALAINKIKRKQYEKEKIETYDHDKIIILEDVTIKELSSNTILNTEYFVLFTDQIAGIIPGKLES